MSKPVDNPADGDAGRFWDLYGTAGSPRTRIRTEPPPPEPPPAQAHTAPPGPASGEDRPDDAHGNGGTPGEPSAAPDTAHECLEWCPICRGAEVLRAGGSPEIRGQLQSVQRDSLMMLRALIDTYLQRPPAEPQGDDDGVEDIPII